MGKPFQLIVAIAFVLTLGVACLAQASTASQYIDDATLTTKVKSALVGDSQLKALQVSVQTTQGSVQLSGTVDNKTQEAAAIKDANQVNGVKSVKDLLTVTNQD